MDYALFLLLLCSSAFFSGSETAFFNLNTRQLTLFMEGNARQKKIAQLRAQAKNLLITVLLGNELTNIALSIVSASIVHRLFHQLSIIEHAIISSMCVIPILLLCGEITPKTIAAFSSERFASVVVYPLSFFAWLVSPVRKVLYKVSNYLVKVFTSRSNSEHDIGLDEQGFRALVDAGVREGEVEEEEQELIHNAFHFGDLNVKAVMRPWSKVFWIHDQMPLNKVIDKVSAYNYSRIPVMQSNQVVGLLYAKDLLAYRWGLHTEMDLDQMMHAHLMTNAEILLSDLMKRFKRQRKHLAIVVNEKQEPIGICTMEDLLEVLFGPIQEEEGLDS